MIKKVYKNPLKFLIVLNVGTIPLCIYLIKNEWLLLTVLILLITAFINRKVGDNWVNMNNKKIMIVNFSFILMIITILGYFLFYMYNIIKNSAH